MKNIKFSIITPTYNEEKDIRKTLESFLDISYPEKEIIVVDDSNDRTPEIVKEYAGRGVRLMRGRGEGCCEAVNLGIKEAGGEVIVNADADVRLPKDFLNRLAEKYENGADWVLVDCRIPNISNSVFSRFIGALHTAEHDGRDDMYYSEAFSCRRELALKLGMFGKSYPARFCRDWLLGKKLTEGGYKKIYDPEIAVEHFQPDNLREYWYVRKTRGRFGPLQQYFMFGCSIPFLVCKYIAKDILFALRFLLVLPTAFRVYKIAKYSKGSVQNFFPFLYAYGIQEFARVVGEWEGIKKILSIPKNIRKASR